MSSDEMRVTSSARIVVSAAIAAMGMCALTAGGWWAIRTGSVDLGKGAGLVLAVSSVVAVGAAAGIVSGRYGAAAISWAVGLIGALAVQEAGYLLDPSWPRGETGFAGSVLYAAVFLLPLLGGGHILGVWARNAGGGLFA